MGGGDLALDGSIRRLAEQQATLGSIRSSAGLVLSATAISTSFLASIGLRDTNGLPWLGLFGLILTAASLIVGMLLLRSVKLVVSISPTTLAEPPWSTFDDDHRRHELAKALDDSANENDAPLGRAWVLLDAAIVCTTASIVAWILLIASAA